MNGLRNYLSRDEVEIVNDDDDDHVGDENIEDVIGPMIPGLVVSTADADQAINGMINDTALNAEENDADDDELLDDSQFPVFP